MTAKEIAQNAQSTRFNSKRPDLLEHQIREYARQKCKEQRDICAMYCTPKNQQFAVLDAPEPNFN